MEGKMARTNRHVRKATINRVLDSLRAIRGLDRAAHFEAGGTPADWRGEHDVRPDRVKEGSRQACRRRPEGEDQ